MAFGEILRNARVQKGLTPSDVAESTHMLVQVVEGLEQEDFRRIAAPIYGRGFVKLYAELLELDPEPLISDFMNLYSGARAPAVLTKSVEPAAEPAPAPQTRTVSEPAVAVRVPQRQPVQPRPAVRAVAVPEISERSDIPPPEVPELRVADEATDAGPDAPRMRVTRPQEAGGASEDKKDYRPSLVVEPEEAYDENDDLDLFRAAASVSRPVLEGAPCPVAETEHARAETKGSVARKASCRFFRSADGWTVTSCRRWRMKRRMRAVMRACRRFWTGFPDLRTGLNAACPSRACLGRFGCSAVSAC